MHSVKRHPASRRPGDRRVQAVACTIAAILVGGLWIGQMAPTHAPDAVTQGTTGPRSVPGATAAQIHQSTVRRDFESAVTLLQAGRNAQAVTALHRVLALAPDMPEAHVNLGFALLGMRQATRAYSHFDRATTLNPNQANAYYGLAMACEARGDLDLAKGAMRTYLHLARNADAAHLRRARAALWEWESRVAAAPAEAPADTRSRQSQPRTWQ